jgi:hypothetical protein
MLARALVALALTAAPLAAQTAATAPARLAAGTFLASRIDRDSLPQTDRVVDTDGTTYLIVFDRLSLSLRADKTFRASVRYRRTLYSADPRGRDRTIPLQTMSVTGTYELVGNVIKFNPDPSEDTRGLRILEGIVVGPREITLPFHYRNGSAERDRTLVMRRNDNAL